MSPSPPASIWARQCWIAASWEAAKSAVSAGDSVRSRYVLRGAAQYRRSNHADCRLGTCGIRLSRRSCSSKRCASCVAMNSRLPMGLPRTTTPCWAAGMAQFPVQQGCSGSSGGSSSNSPGGSSPALFHARVLLRCTWMLACLARAWTGGGGPGLNQGSVLAQSEQRWHQCVVPRLVARRALCPLRRRRRTCSACRRRVRRRV